MSIQEAVVQIYAEAEKWILLSVVLQSTWKFLTYLHICALLETKHMYKDLMWNYIEMTILYLSVTCTSSCLPTMGTALIPSSPEVTQASWSWGTRSRSTCTYLVPHVVMPLPFLPLATSLTRWEPYANRVSFGQSLMMVS